MAPFLKSSVFGLGLALLAGCGTIGSPLPMAGPIATTVPVSAASAQADSSLSAARQAIERFYTARTGHPTIVGGSLIQTSISDLVLTFEAGGIAYSGTEHILSTTYDDEDGTKTSSTSSTPVSGRYEPSSGQVLPN